MRALPIEPMALPVLTRRMAVRVEGEPYEVLYLAGPGVL